MMAQPTILHGDWEELVASARALGAHRNLTLIIPAEEEAPAASGESPSPSLPAAEKIRALDSLAAKNHELPGLPDEAFDREKLYEDFD